MSGSFNKTSPNSHGGAFGLDSNTGGGITLNKHQASIPSGHWNMGDALSMKKGQWDDKLDELEEEEIESTHSSIEKKAHTSYKQHASDPFANVKNDKFSFGNIGNTVASVISISDSTKYEGEKIVESYIKEVLLELGISGNIAVQSKKRAKNTGGKYDKAYPIDSNDIGSMGMTTAAYIGVINKLHKQSRTDSDDGNSAVGGKYGKTKKQYSQDLEDFDSGEKSTSDIYLRDFDNEYIDKTNIDRFYEKQ